LGRAGRPQVPFALISPESTDLTILRGPPEPFLEEVPGQKIGCFTVETAKKVANKSLK
jgi:hypothetical protein